jgi:hypothetical protein
MYRWGATPEDCAFLCGEPLAAVPLCVCMRRWELQLLACPMPCAAAGSPASSAVCSETQSRSV